MTELGSCGGGDGDGDGCGCGDAVGLWGKETTAGDAAGLWGNETTGGGILFGTTWGRLGIPSGTTFPWPCCICGRGGLCGTGLGQIGREVVDDAEEVALLGMDEREGGAAGGVNEFGSATFCSGGASRSRLDPKLTVVGRGAGGGGGEGLIGWNGLGSD